MGGIVSFGGSAYRMSIHEDINKGEDEQDNLIVLDVFPHSGSPVHPSIPPYTWPTVKPIGMTCALG